MLILKWVSFHFYCSEKKGNIRTMFEHFLNYPLPQTISRAYFLTTLEEQEEKIGKKMEQGGTKRKEKEKERTRRNNKE